MPESRRIEPGSLAALGMFALQVVLWWIWLLLFLSVGRSFAIQSLLVNALWLVGPLRGALPLLVAGIAAFACGWTGTLLLHRMPWVQGSIHAAAFAATLLTFAIAALPSFHSLLVMTPTWLIVATCVLAGQAIALRLARPALLERDTLSAPDG